MEDTLVKRVLPHSIEAEQSVIGSDVDGPGRRDRGRRKS